MTDESYGVYFFFFSYFISAFRLERLIGSYVNDEFKRIWKEAVMA
jgi:hypothetical protein